ncbi:MAG TPA: DUF1844 domain-containing protein [Acidobacteriota bacterium]|nr:DUF1844 domain-containing protein [Acidobacteriota bacterium]
MSEKKESPGFKVTDRRKFDSSGNPRKPDADEETESSAGGAVEIGSSHKAKPPSQPGQPGQEGPGGGESMGGGRGRGPGGAQGRPAGRDKSSGGGGAIPFPPQEVPSQPHSPSGEEPGEQEVDFSAFIMSMATGVLMALGEVPDPMTGRQGPVHLESARHTIDILAMLREKTRGNLDAEEDRIMGQVLYELRMKYMEVVKKLGK